MTNYKICVYAICKDEEHFVDRWINSMSEADQIIVTDTGSTDNTVEKLRAHGALVFREEIKPWRFDATRNISLDHVPGDADICVCTDLDEVFEPGWRAKLETAWHNSEPEDGTEIARSGRYLYNWSLKPDGTPDVQFYYSKIHERHGFRWKYPVHEHIEYKGDLPLKNVFIEGMTLNHYPDPAKTRGSYLPLLELAAEEYPGNDRMRYYLGREYLYKRQWQKCIDTLTAYLALPTALWNEERCAAMRWIGAAYRQLGETSEAYRWYFRAIAETPHMRDAYIEFAQLCYKLKDWPMILFLTEDALKIGDKSPTYINMGYAWDHTPDDLCSLAAYYMGLMDRALAHAKKAVSHSPCDKRLYNNLMIISGGG